MYSPLPKGLFKTTLYFVYCIIIICVIIIISGGSSAGHKGHVSPPPPPPLHPSFAALDLTRSMPPDPPRGPPKAACIQLECPPPFSFQITGSATDYTLVLHNHWLAADLSVNVLCVLQLDVTPRSTSTTPGQTQTPGPLPLLLALVLRY